MSLNSSIIALKQSHDCFDKTASERIRERLGKAGHRFHANDNIAAFLEDGELDELRIEVEGKLHEVLRALVIDTVGDHNTAQTARRLAKLYIDEVFRGRYQPPPPATAFPNVSQVNELMVVGPLKVRSTCSHHLCPIIGKVWIGVLPSVSSELIGLSKYARLCDWVMSRPQIQEEAVVTLADELERRVQPDGLALVMEAGHYCMHWRGVKDDQSLMRSTAMRGAFARSADLRREFLGLLGSGPI